MKNTYPLMSHLILIETTKKHSETEVGLKPVKIKTEISGPVKIISGNINPEAGLYFFQAGAFVTHANTEQLANNISRLNKEKCGIIKEGNMYKVRFGYFMDARSANLCLKQLKESGYPYFIGEVKGFKK